MQQVFQKTTVRDVKDFAENLRSRLQAKHGFTLGQSKMLHLLAEVNGLSSWAAFERQLLIDRPSNSSPILRGTKDQPGSGSENSRRRELYIKYLGDFDDVLEILNLRMDPDYSYESETVASTIDTPYGAVDRQELTNLLGLFGCETGKGSYTNRLLESANRLHEESKSSRRIAIVRDVEVLAEMLDTVLYREPPTVPLGQVEISLGAFALKVRDETSWLSEPDGDGPASALVDILDFATRLEP